jgi:hypothetical protein
MDRRIDASILGEHFQFDLIVPDAALFALLAAMTCLLGRNFRERSPAIGEMRSVRLRPPCLA